MENDDGSRCVTPPIQPVKIALYKLYHRQWWCYRHQLQYYKWWHAAVKKFIPSTKHVFKRFWSVDILKNGFVGPTGIIRKKFWTHPRKGTVMRLVKNAKRENMKTCMKKYRKTFLT